MSSRAATLWLALMGVAYGAIVVPNWNLGHLDFGDGNYMYISWRVAGGTVLYRDILAPQPPVHLLLGALIYRVGSLFSHPLFAFRAFSLILHVATMGLVYLAALQALGGDDPARRATLRPTGVLAAAVYMLLPLGFWWTLGYQSEPTEMFFILVAFVLTMRWTPAAMAAGGTAMACAVLTNMTAVPYALFFLAGLAIRRPRLLLAFALPFATVVAGTAALMEWRTGAFFENVIGNQVGSFPRPEFLPPGQTVLDYALGKVMREGADVLALEGGFIVVALLGIMRYARRGPVSVRECAALFSVCAMLSILYVSKGGTVDYIFTIAEPFVAIFAAYTLVFFAPRGVEALKRLLPSTRDWSPLAVWGSAVLLLAAMLGPGLRHSWLTLRGATYEADEAATMQVVREIERNCPPDGRILSPPHYAFVARRPIAEDYSELLLWTLKYRNEKFDGVRGRAVQVVEKIATDLRAKRIPFVVLDLNQTAKLPEIAGAIAEAYKPVRAREFQTLNTRLQFYVPKTQ